MIFSRASRRTISAFLSVVLACSLFPSSGSTESDDALLKQLDDIRTQQTIFASQAGDLQQQLGASSEGIQAFQAQLAKQQSLVAASKAKVDDITKRMNALKKQRDQFMTASYIAGDNDSLIGALVGSGSLTEFLSRGQYAQFMVSKRVSILEDVDANLQKLDKERRDVVTVQNGIETQIADLQRRISDLQRQLAENAANQDAANALEAALAGLTGNYNRNNRVWINNNEPIGGRFAFIGGGTEHGLGMSQYGAKGMAQQGKNYRDILSHYYLATSIITIGDNPQVNVGGDLETYLVGVVEAEMNSNWPMEALKAQAVAARSYAYINRSRLDNSPRTQAWVGPSLQTANARRAVAETRGQVLAYAGQVIPAYFHSTSGGYTENNENVWGGTPLPWLRGASSPWETDSPHWEWRTAVYSREQMQAIISRDSRTNVGQLQTIKIVGRGVGGRVTSLQIIGSDGTKTVSGPTFKSVFNAYSPGSDPGLRSTLFAFI